jgi:1-acyl-sn-glycerol-3-phosphate acyltransferase
MIDHVTSHPDSDPRDKAPSAEEIDRKFHSLRVLAARPVIWAAIETLKVIRGFGWDGYFDEDLHRVEDPMIFAANHRSHVDTAAILGTLPATICKRTVVAAALDVFGPDNNGGIKRKLSKDCLQFITAAGFHAFAFDRLGPPLRSVRTSVQLIRNGWNLLLYPEGTRSRNGEIAPFKPGVALLAKFTKRPVIPVHVEGGDAILPYCGFMPRRARAIVRYGSPILYQVDDTPASFTAKIEEQVRLLGARNGVIVRKPVLVKPFLGRLGRPRPQAAGVHHPY